MSFIGRETAHQVGHIETRMSAGGVDHRSPQFIKPTRDWIEDTLIHMGRFDDSPPKTRLPFLTAAWRRLPVFDYLPFQPLNGASPLARYQGEDGVWKHDKVAVEQLRFLSHSKYSHEDIVRLAFAYGGDIKKICNLLQASVEIGKQVPDVFALEALILAEILLARHEFEIEFQLGSERAVRVSDASKKAEKAKAAIHDPYAHLYQAHELIKLAEELLPSY